jgi:hypothetical protein
MRALLFAAMLACAAAGAEAQPINAAMSDGFLAPGYYVATTGNDSNAGTLAAPFATIAKCQTAMRGSSTKTCYIRAGTYSYSTSFSSCYGNSFAAEMTTADNGETLSYTKSP